MTAIKHIHLENCLSTQDEMKNFLKNTSDEFIAISTARQDEGRGRRDNKWLKIGDQIALSLAIKPHSTLTLTPLEIALLVCDFFQQEFKTTLKLKWPNDLLNYDHEKVGGILCEVHQSLIITGIGINLYADHCHLNLDYPVGFVLTKEYLQNIQDLNHRLAKFIFVNRIKSSHDLISRWNQRCVHLNRIVLIQDNDKEFIGTFLGIGDNGEAIIDMNGKEFKVFTGSLRINH